MSRLFLNGARWMHDHPLVTVLIMGSMLMVGCGLGQNGEDSEEQSPVSQMFSSHDEALIPVDEELDRADFDKPGTPQRVGTPQKWRSGKDGFGRDDDDGPGADDDDPILVRETGFRPAEDDDVIEVRETGFLGRPELRLTGMDGETGLVEWDPVAGADSYEISGTRYAVEGVALESFTEDLSNTRARVRTQGLYTRVRVVAVAREGLDRSKPSNEVEIFTTPRN